MAKRSLFKQNVLIFFIIIFVYSCRDNEDKSSESADTTNSPAMIEVENFLKNKTLSTIDMERTFGYSSHTFMQISSNNTSEDFELDWSTLQNDIDEEGNIVLIIGLKSEYPFSGLVFYRNEGKEKTHVNIAASKLVLWKLKGGIVGRILTYIPDYKFSRDSINNIMQLGYKLEDSNFSGIKLVSTLDGLFLYGDKYDEGRNLFHFLPSEIYRKTVEKKDSTQLNSSIKKLSKEHIYFKLFSEKTRLTSKAVYTTQEGGGLRCSFCGRPVNECTCVIITPPTVYCPRCGMQIKYCLCCSRCNNYPCICCKSCFHYPCICCRICHHYPCICCKVCHHYPCTCSSSGSGGGGINPNPGELKPNKKIPYEAKDFPGYRYQGKDCYKLADYILHQMIPDYSEPGVPYYIKKADENGNITNVGNTKTAVNIINEHLDANRPIKVGVDYRNGGNQSDHMTDHWIVINGRGFDTAKQQYYFNYIETGRYKSSAAQAVGDNRLYYDSNKGTISGKKWDKIHTYVVNQIKTNKK